MFLNEHYGPEDIFPLYRDAAGCVVSSLHDGMNLVAKEFVAARGDGRGVLVLSKFTGAARELTDAVLVNPFDVAELADGLYAALTMSADEQERRMRRMRRPGGRPQHLPLGRDAPERDRETGPGADPRNPDARTGPAGRDRAGHRARELPHGDAAGERVRPGCGSSTADSGTRRTSDHEEKS